MPYFHMSTANPTGHRPWNFALQGLGRLRGRGRMGFYQPATYPLPANTLGSYIPRLPMLAVSPHSGKADYGDPKPVYGPLQPAYYQGLGAVALPSWFTDPTQSVVTGIPNWGLVAAGLGALLLLKRR
jgi:hypothetical protein